MTIYVKSAEPFTVPSTVALCSKCGGRLMLEVYEWFTDSRKVTPVGFSLGCENDCDLWLGAEDIAVMNWLDNNVKVAPGKGDRVTVLTHYRAKGRVGGWEPFWYTGTVLKVNRTTALVLRIGWTEPELVRLDRISQA